MKSLRSGRRVAGCWTRLRIWRIRFLVPVCVPFLPVRECCCRPSLSSRYNRYVVALRLQQLSLIRFLGLPYALHQAGFVTGIILLVVLCGVTDWTIRLIVVNAKLSGRSSYIGIMDRCFGQSGKAFVSLFQFAFAFGGMCAFGIIIGVLAPPFILDFCFTEVRDSTGDTIPHVIRSIFPTLSTTPVLKIFTNRQFIIAFCTTCISYPLSLYRDIHKLARASGFALIGMVIIVCSVVFEGPHASSTLKGDPNQRFTVIEPRIFEAIGVISFAFVCHHNSLLIYGSLRTPTLDRFNAVTHISTAISLVCCLLMAISAYVVFTDKTQGNILNNFSAVSRLLPLLMSVAHPILCRLTHSSTSPAFVLV